MARRHARRDRGRIGIGGVLVAATALIATACQQGPEFRPATTTTTSSVTVPSTTTTTTAPQPTLTPLPRTFDEAAVQDAVHKVLTESYQVRELGMVICPSGKRVRAGTSFHCTTTVAGEPKKVLIKVVNDEGRYTVGMPE